MKTNVRSASVALLAALVLTASGCNRQSRGNADAPAESRAVTPAEGGGTSTAGSAGQSKNFGDTRTKTEQDGQSPSASPTGLSTDASSKTPNAGSGTSTRGNEAPKSP